MTACRCLLGMPLALAPTPILKLDRLSRRLGVELYVKRDDLTGLLESGNKVRKLEFLVGEALAQARRHPRHLRHAAVQLLPCRRPRWRPASASTRFSR